jgi:uncharacterized damage-inducible protein DinB
VSVAVDLGALVAYSDHERTKWRAWVASDPSRLAIPFQPGGRFPTIGSLLNHVFLVERRHFTRLQGGEVPSSTGVTDDDWQGLFAYADAARSDFRHYLETADDKTASQSLTFSVQSGTYTMSRRKLAVHILLHEVRHFAQIAYAARVSGHAPPGEHDYFYASESTRNSQHASP